MEIILDYVVVASAVLPVLSVVLPVRALANADARLWYDGFLEARSLPINILSSNAFSLSWFSHAYVNYLLARTLDPTWFLFALRSVVNTLLYNNQHTFTGITKPRGLSAY